eukprot:754657-Hanusia_phi.AAC.5
MLRFCNDQDREGMEANDRLCQDHLKGGPFDQLARLSSEEGGQHGAVGKVHYDHVKQVVGGAFFVLLQTVHRQLVLILARQRALLGPLSQRLLLVLLDRFPQRLIALEVCLGEGIASHRRVTAPLQPLLDRPALIRVALPVHDRIAHQISCDGADEVA